MDLEGRQLVINYLRTGDFNTLLEIINRSDSKECLDAIGKIEIGHLEQASRLKFAPRVNQDHLTLWYVLVYHPQPQDIVKYVSNKDLLAYHQYQVKVRDNHYWTHGYEEPYQTINQEREAHLRQIIIQELQKRGVWDGRFKPRRLHR